MQVTPLKWPLARVFELISGADGVAGTTKKRAVTKLESSVKNPDLSKGGRMFGATADTTPCK